MVKSMRYLPTTYLHDYDIIIYILISKSPVAHAQCHHSSVIPIINRYLLLNYIYATEIIYDN